MKLELKLDESGRGPVRLNGQEIENCVRIEIEAQPLHRSTAKLEVLVSDATEIEIDGAEVQVEGIPLRRWQELEPCTCKRGFDNDTLQIDADCSQHGDLVKPSGEGTGDV